MVILDDWICILVHGVFFLWFHIQGRGDVEGLI